MTREQKWAGGWILDRIVNEVLAEVHFDQWLEGSEVGAIHILWRLQAENIMCQCTQAATYLCHFRKSKEVSVSRIEQEREDY